MRHFLWLIIFSLVTISLEAHPGIGMVYDGEYTIYYTDLVHVWKLDIRTGESEIAIENIHTHELAMDSQGNLYGEHYWYIESEQKFKNYIWKFSPDGTFNKIREDQYGENEDFSFVRDADFAAYRIRPNGELFEIIRADTTGEVIWHKLTLNDPGWMYIDTEKLYFVDYPALFVADTNAISELLPDISAHRFPFSIQSDHHNIYGIWTDSNENVYTAIYGGRSIKKVNAVGEESTVYTSSFFWSPVSGFFDNDKNLWLIEGTINGRIRVKKIPIEELKSGAGFFLENLIFMLISLSMIGLIFSRYRKKWK